MSWNCEDKGWRVAKSSAVNTEQTLVMNDLELRQLYCYHFMYVCRTLSK